MVGLSGIVLIVISPETLLPTRWNLSGEPETLLPAWIALSITPAIAAVIALIFWAWPRLEPRRLNLERSGSFYRTAWLATLGLLAAVHGILAAAALGARIPVPTLALVAAGLLLIAIGNQLGKSRSNFFLGVRTPWTLCSETAWIKTNRLAGKLLVAYGGFLLVTPLLGLTVTMFLILSVGGVVTILLVSVVYSFLVWRRAVDQQSE